MNFLIRKFLQKSLGQVCNNVSNCRETAPIDLNQRIRNLNHSGSNAMTNPFHGVTANGKYAVDIVKINRLGKRAKSLFLKHLSQYYIFGNEARSLCKGIKVMLSHLREDSITISNGNMLAEDQYVVEVENFGDTHEPHLHIQENSLDRKPIAIRFGEKFLSINDLYTSR